MEKKAISSSEMHTSLAPISHAIEVGDTVYISGKIGFTKEGKLAGGGLCGEVHQAMKNFGSVLTAAGCTFDNGMLFTLCSINIINLLKNPGDKTQNT